MFLPLLSTHVRHPFRLFFDFLPSISRFFPLSCFCPPLLPSCYCPSHPPPRSKEDIDLTGYEWEDGCVCGYVYANYGLLPTMETIDAAITVLSS